MLFHFYSFYILDTKITILEKGSGTKEITQEAQSSLKKEPFAQVPSYHFLTTTSFVCSGPYDTPLY